MNNPLGVSPSKGNQGTKRGKEKIFWPRWESVGSIVRTNVGKTDCIEASWDVQPRYSSCETHGACNLQKMLIHRC